MADYKLPRVTIMRGVPGSGKSTWVSKNRENAYVISADHEFIDPDGVYRFDRDRLRQAHDACLKRFLAAVHAGTIDIVVDNTNTRVFEIAPYYRLAEAFGYHVEIVWVAAPLAEAAARCVHGVPVEAVRAMAAATEALPAWWNLSVVDARS